MFYAPYKSLLTVLVDRYVSIGEGKSALLAANFLKFLFLISNIFRSRIRVEQDRVNIRLQREWAWQCGPGILGRGLGLLARRRGRHLRPDGDQEGGQQRGRVRDQEETHKGDEEQH